MVVIRAPSAGSSLAEVSAILRTASFTSDRTITHHNLTHRAVRPSAGKQPQHGRKSGLTDKKKAQIKRARRQHAIKARLQRLNSDTPEHPFRHVYVGNLGPNVTEDAIKEHLKPCGPVLSVQICCVGGSVSVNSKSAVPSKRYATVIFVDPVAVPRAVDFYNGSRLDGRNLMVAAFLWKLPEMRAILDAQRLNPIRNLQPVGDSMAKSAALNPTSMPFFPGGIRASEDEGGTGPSLGFSMAGIRDQERASMSSLSISSQDFRSLKSSPAPSFESRDGARDVGVRFQQSPPTTEWPRHSPAPRSVEGDKPFSPFDNRVQREESISSSVDTSPATEDNSVGFNRPDNGMLAHGNGNGVSSLRQGRLSSSIGIHPANSRASFPGNVVVTSSSPVSSIGSGSHFASGMELSSSFEAQLRASPLIHDIFDRISRCEVTTREIRSDLSDVHRKLDMLIERSIALSAQPEFKDPFAPSPPSIGFGGPQVNGPRPSISGGLAPNQSSDDITQISQRLNTLTSSVGQLLAIQTQQHIHTTTASLGGNQLPGLGSQPIDVPSNRVMSPSLADLIFGPLDAPRIRRCAPGLPASIDLPVRPPGGMDVLGRSDSLLRDKRRSVSTLMRRDSAGMDLSGTSPRDAAGPTLSKWDQLALAPELLRSLTKFGVGPPNKIQQRALPFLLRGADIIAQAPPTQERIAAYVIPAIHIALVNTVGLPPHRGPIVVMISTTVDQATQAQRMIRDLGGPIGIRSALGVGTPSPNSDLTQELRLLQQNMPHIICGTPQKLHALFTASGGLVGSQVRFLVLDEVDQLTRATCTISSSTSLTSASQTSLLSVDSNSSSSLAPPFQGGRRASGISTPPLPQEGLNGSNGQIERQTALFSNTVPQDVLNLATAIQLREPVRVLVRRDGNVTHADTSQGARGLRQFYLYLAFTAGGRSDPAASTPSGGLGIIGSGRGSTNPETAQAREWKLDALSDLFDDVDVPQAIVHVGGMAALDAVVYKLASRGLEAVPLHGDMNAGTKLAALNKFRIQNTGLMRPLVTKILVVYDVQVKTPDISHVPLVINYDLPKAVEEYAHRVAPAIAPSHSRAGVIVNFVTATGGDVEMLRSIECFYKIKCPEVPMSLRDIV
ncbi:hypothetical protein EWM64_g172 [Hericium alpestre]|uniref:RNA helicase n=1 Tax=Hericium alpestre TaxID=135208 RepID=A0A4Z0A9V6_9AGAM|nr:hypothetical protein EWM64_g172 [Hericium alpestre]